MKIKEKLADRVSRVNSMLCVGFDSDVEKMPERFRSMIHPQFEFNKWIIDETHEFVCAYKPNLAFYEAYGARGMVDLDLTMKYLRVNCPDIVTIADGKRADIDSTNMGYVRGIFDELGFDSVTINPYLGGETLKPFLDREDKASIILCRTTNVGAAEFQDLPVDGKPLWRVVAEHVVDEWNKNDNCMMVVGAAETEILRQVREIAGEMDFLVPGVGAQGGDLEEVMKVGVNKAGKGLIINAGRSVIFAQNPGEEAKKLRELILAYK